MNTGQIVGIAAGGLGLWWLGGQLGWWGATPAVGATPAGPGGIIPAGTPQPTTAPPTNTGSPMANAPTPPPSLSVADAAVFPYSSSVTAVQMQNIHDALVTELQGGQIPTIAGNSVLAYMLGWGGVPAGTSRTTVGDTYVYDGANWNLQTWLPKKGLSAYMTTGPRLMTHASRRNYVRKPRMV